MTKYRHLKIQRVSLWKERLLSSTLNAYESRLDKSSYGIVRRNDVELFLRETFQDKAAAFDSRRAPNEASIMIYIGIDSYLRRSTATLE